MIFMFVCDFSNTSNLRAKVVSLISDKPIKHPRCRRDSSRSSCYICEHL